MEPASKDYESGAANEPVADELAAEASEAARRGALGELDLLLARLRVVAPDRADELDERLHVVARCVRAHPSYGHESEAPPVPGEGRAAG